MDLCANIVIDVPLDVEVPAKFWKLSGNRVQIRTPDPSRFAPVVVPYATTMKICAI